jgi:tetratricopeptide (TPR) repeat protein
MLLAFLAASFIAHNSDLWFHLASGRRLARREFAFGTDPFAYTTAQQYWANRSWLFDLVFYFLHGLLGGVGLVVLKALLVATLVGLLLSIRRPNAGAGLPILCTTLAVLAMSPRLLLQPACVSYFLLGLTLWLLGKPHADKAERPFPLSRSLGLLLVFALWVNVDEWFFLGPALTVLFWIGERLRGPRRLPGWLVPASWAACLLNPHGYYVFTTLPSELSTVPWTSKLILDARFQVLFASPWQPPYFRAAATGNAAVLSYFALTALGIVSFLLHWPALRDWRLLVWLPFASLAAWQARTIPFFVLVAAPITALNWQDVFQVRSQKSEVRMKDRPLLHSVFCILTSAFLLALLFLTWMGWLAGYDREERYIGWGIEAEPSLRRVTETLDYLRRKDLLLPGERVFAIHPEVAQYGAWFCSKEQHFFDHRYPLYPEAARDFESACRGLSFDGDGLDIHGKGWRQVLRENNVGIVVLYDREPGRFHAVLHRLSADPKRWTLLSNAGQAAIFGWNEARAPGAFAAVALNIERLAFGPQDERAKHELPAAPDRGPEQMPPRRDFRARLARPAAPLSWESPAATTYLHYFDDSAAWQRQDQFNDSLRSFAASLVGLPSLPSAAPGVLMPLVSSHAVLYPRAAAAFLTRDQLGPYFASLTERSPALALLAVRAARRAIADNPADSNAWLRLGQAYLVLRNLTCEHTTEGVLPPLFQLRHVQIVTALEQALRLDPDLEAAHHELAYLYGDRNQLDRALAHRREEVRLTRRAGPRPGENAETFAYRLQKLDQDTDKLEGEVQNRRANYAANSRVLQGERVRQAELALRMGLGQLAIEEILLPSPADLLGAKGIKLELELLLESGRIDEVRASLRNDAVMAGKDVLPYHDMPAPRSRQGTALYPVPYHWPAYEWLRVLQSAAKGDYALATADLRTIRAGLRAGHERVKRQQAGFERFDRALSPLLLSGPLPFLPAFAAGALGNSLPQRGALRTGEPLLRAQQADLLVLEGLLAVEQGNPDAARSAFVEAQKLSNAFAGGPIASGYLRKLREIPR